MGTDRLGGDAPIEGPGQDLLGFEPFTRALATGLVERAPDAGFVVGLQARWGMGKSSAVNLCLNHMRETEMTCRNEERVVIQTFNPWFFSGVDALTNGYLSLLGDAVEEAIAPGMPNLASRGWRRVKRLWQSTPSHSETIGHTLASAATILSGGSAAPLSGAVRGTIVSALKKPNSADLAKRFKKLLARIEKIKGRVLIVVDDLDRLQADDLRQVLTLIKTFGNLPRVTHLLVYDRDIVDTAVADARPEQEGRRLPSYREKIVQVEFDLPLATQDGLKRLIARGIDPLIVDERQFDQMDWFYAMELALRLYLKSPRDVIRFTNVLSVTWPSLAGEAYFPDLFVIELWRLFERDFYDGVRDHKALMVGDQHLVMLDEERAKVIRSICDRVPESRRSHVVRAFHRLFPVAAKRLPDNHMWGHSVVPDRWRVGDARGFDVFFRMSPPEGEYTQHEVSRLRSALSDENALDLAVTDALARPAPDGGTFLPKLLRVLWRLSREPFDPPVPLMNVMARRGEEILTQAGSEPEMAWWGGRMEIAGIVRSCLLHIPANERLVRLNEAMTGAGLSTRALIVAHQYEPHDEKQRERVKTDPSALQADEARALAEDLVAEVEGEPGKLLATPLGWQAISLWNTVKGPDPIQQWVERNIADPKVIVWMIDLVMATVTSTEGKTRELRGEVSWEFFDLHGIHHAAVKMLEDGRITDADRVLVKAFIKDGGDRLGRQANKDQEEEGI